MHTSNRYWVLSFALLVACSSDESGVKGGSQSQRDGSSDGGSAGNTGGSSGSSGGSATGGAQNGAYLSCDNPKPLVLGGKDTGYVTCDGGAVHRKTITECPNLLPRTNGGACQTTGPGLAAEPCTKDADCAKNPNGYCEVGPTGHYPACECFYGCSKDADCASGQICECGDPVGTCRPATCTQDSACPTGSLCASAPIGWGGCSFYGLPIGFQCQATGDVCLTDQQCASPTPVCAFDADAGVRGCHPPQLACP